MSKEISYEELEQRLHNLNPRENRQQELERKLLKSQELYRLLAENVSDVIWILDVESEQFRYVSPSVQQLRGFTPEEAVKQNLQETLTPASYTLLKAQITTRIEGFEKGVNDVFFNELEQTHREGHTVWTEVKTRYLRNLTSGRVEEVGVTRDISDRKEMEKEREELIQTLQAALDEVKVLRGIMPICSFCKKIRDDQGYWNKLEAYLTEHSEAELSHSICKDCAKKHYPDLDIYDDD